MLLICRKIFTDTFFRHKIGLAVFLDLGRLTHDFYQLLSYYYVHMSIITHKIFSEVAIYKKTLHKDTSQLLVKCSYVALYRLFKILTSLGSFANGGKSAYIGTE